jgi:hypothetical protein
MLLAVSKSEDNSSRLLAPIGEMTGHKQHSQSIKLEGKGVSAAALDSASAGEAGSQIQSPLYNSLNNGSRLRRRLQRT